MGRNTKKAIASYQVDNGLLVDGTISDALLGSLGYSNQRVDQQLTEAQKPLVLTIDGYSPTAGVGGKDRTTSYPANR